MVELVRQNYNVNKKIFESIKNELRNKLDKSIPIEHVGSTAIKGMYGKNIIDILIGAKDKDEFLYIESVLCNLKYIPSIKSKSDISEFFSNTRDETKSGDIHIHLVIIDTDKYREFILLRDYLINNKMEAKKYSDFKKYLVSNGIVDRKE